MSDLVFVMAAAATLSLAVIGVRLRFCRAGLDHPGHRSLHDTPTPHGGGLGIVAAALAAGAWAGVSPPWLAAIAALAAVSLADDWWQLPSWLRLAVHLGVSAGVVFVHGQPPTAAAALAVLLMTWATNAYNFMDGADGLAGSMALVGFAAYAVAFADAGAVAMAQLCAAIAAASLAFLAYNWHPARIFMGDVGAIPLGFVAGGLGWWAVAAELWAAWFPLLVFAPFLLDASVTLARRALRRERVWQAHRDHYYQRMVRMGCAHGRMCAHWLALMLAGAALALWLHLRAPALGWAGLLGWALLLGALGRRVDRRWDQHTTIKT